MKASKSIKTIFLNTITFTLIITASFMVMGFPKLWADKKDLKVYIIETMPVDIVIRSSERFKEKLKLEFGETIDIRTDNASGSLETAHKMVKRALAEFQPDLVVSVATMASMVAQEHLSGTDIPQLFMVVADPVGAGLAEGMGQASGGKRTGLGLSVDRNRRVDLASTLIGTLDFEGPEIRIGIPHSSYPSSKADAEKLKAIGLAHNFSFISIEVPYRDLPENIETLLSEIREAINSQIESIDYLWEPTGPLAEHEEYTELLLEFREQAPLISGNRFDSVQKGALFAVQTDAYLLGEEAAEIAKRILNGDDVSRIPVTYANSTLLAVNIQTAKQMGIVLPTSILQAAEGRVYQ